LKDGSSNLQLARPLLPAIKLGLFSVFLRPVFLMPNWLSHTLVMDSRLSPAYLHNEGEVVGN
jgi:hypothetical protein